jgi:hypothetical protein
MSVYVVSLDIAYEGSTLLGVFSDYVKARQHMLSLCVGASADDDYVIRKVELDKVYSDFYGEIGEKV